jgi:RND family efflux transporter MFP subunit
VVLGVAGCNAGKQAEPARRPPTVTVVLARKMDVPIIAQPNATTRALRDVTIRARVKGFLKEKHFSEGSNVKKDDLMLVIDEEPFKVKVAQAQALLEAAQADLEKAKQSKSREVSKAQEDEDQAALDLARVEERREQSLLNRAATSRENVDRSVAVRKKDEAVVRLDAANREQATADYNSNLLVAKANVAKAEADLAEAKLDLGYCTMIAPISGRAGELQVKLGNLVGPATGQDNPTALVTIQQLAPMGIEVRAASRYLPLITSAVKTGLDLGVTLHGEKLHPHRGRVFFVDNSVDPTTSTVLVKAEIPNPDETLLPGEYVKADVTVGTFAGAIVVPEQAVVEVQEGTRVLTVDAEGAVQAAIVKPLDTYQGLRVLESGIEPNQRVIVEGIQLARPGQKVAVEEADIEKYVRKSAGSETPDPLSSPLVRLRGKENDQTETPRTPGSEDTPQPPKNAAPAQNRKN